MAGIQSGVNPSTLVTVGEANKAIYAELRDQEGASITVKHGSNQVGNPHGALVAGMNDNTYRLLRLDRTGSVRPGFDNLTFHDEVEGTTVNTQLWAPTTTTFTQAQVQTTGINLNSGNGLAANSSSVLVSQKHFAKIQGSPLRARFRNRVIPQVNATSEFGFGLPTSNTEQIPTGSFWRYTRTGAVVPVIAYNGADIVTGADISSLLSSANYYTWSVIVDDDNVVFACQDVSTGKIINEQTIQLPLSQPKMWSATHLPVFSRLYVSASPAPAAPYMHVSDSMVLGMDLVTNKPWSHQLITASAAGAEVHQTSYAATANWTNSTAPVSATLSNTTPGYPGQYLDGYYGFAAVAGAATDYVLFAHQVPVGYTLVVTGIEIDAYVTGAAIATTATLLHWFMGVNSSAASLATAGLIRKHLGAQSLAVGAAVGAMANPVVVDLAAAPLRTEGGRWCQIGFRMPVGTATASQVIQGGIRVLGYYE